MSLALLLALGFAGSVGAMSRASLDAAILRAREPHWPAGIFFVNVLGCFLFALLAPLLPDILNPSVAKVLTTGFLGGFTTFSTAMVDAVELLRSRKPLKGIAVLLGTFICSLVAFLLGYLATSLLIS